MINVNYYEELIEIYKKEGIKEAIKHDYLSSKNDLIRLCDITFVRDISDSIIASCIEGFYTIPALLMLPITLDKIKEGMENNR